MYHNKLLITLLLITLNSLHCIIIEMINVVHVNENNFRSLRCPFLLSDSKRKSRYSLKENIDASVDTGDTNLQK
jgi:hypothetical protein